MSTLVLETVNTACNCSTNFIRKTMFRKVRGLSAYGGGCCCKFLFGGGGKVPLFPLVPLVGGYG
jgi:hypothetical protein